MLRVHAFRIAAYDLPTANTFFHIESESINAIWGITEFAQGLREAVERIIWRAHGSLLHGQSGEPNLFDQNKSSPNFRRATLSASPLRWRDETVWVRFSSLSCKFVVVMRQNAPVKHSHHRHACAGFIANISSQAEFLGRGIKDKPLTGEEKHLQSGATVADHLHRRANNERMGPLILFAKLSENGTDQARSEASFCSCASFTVCGEAGICNTVTC